MKKISIVIPTYNSEKYLPKFFESLKQQDYKNVECIVVDNVSNDNTLNIVKKYENVFDIKVLSEPDSGQGEAVSKGLDMATGDIHHWHAADDLIAPGALKLVEANFSSNKDLDLIFSDGLAFSDKSTRVYISWPAKGLTKEGALNYFERFQSDTAYWNANLTKKNLPLRNDIPLMVDEEFFIRIIASSKIIKHSDQYLGLFRVREGQISQVNKKKKQDLDVLRKEFREKAKSLCGEEINIVKSSAYHIEYILFFYVGKLSRGIKRVVWKKNEVALLEYAHSCDLAEIVL